MEHSDDHFVLHDGTQRIVVSHLPGYQHVHGAALEDIPPRTRADCGGLHVSRCQMRLLRGGDHDVLEATKSFSQTSHQLGNEDWLGKLDLPTVARAIKASRRWGGGGLDDRPGLCVLPVTEHINEPVVQAPRNSVDGRMGTIDGDVPLGELKDDVLLGIVDVDRL